MNLNTFHVNLIDLPLIFNCLPLSGSPAHTNRINRGVKMGTRSQLVLWIPANSPFPASAIALLQCWCQDHVLHTSLWSNLNHYPTATLQINYCSSYSVNSLKSEVFLISFVISITRQIFYRVKRQWNHNQILMLTLTVPDSVFHHVLRFTAADPHNTHPCSPGKLFNGTEADASLYL